jgi:predicted permease
MRTWVEHTTADLRFAFRRLRRAPWYTAIVLSTLVVGIASVTAIFSFLYSIYWRPLPFKNADRIMAIGEQRRDERCCGAEVTALVARQIASRTQSFDRVGFWRLSFAGASVGDEARSMSGLLADASTMAILDIRPLIGRLPTDGEIDASAPVALINERVWRAAFGADSGVLGRRLRVGNDELTVIGILPASFSVPRQTDVLRGLAASAVRGSIDNRESVGVLARLRPGVTRAAAQAELNALATHLEREPAIGAARTQLRFLPEMLDRRASAFPLPWLFIGASMFLLVIACSNVMNLVLMRGAERRGEMAVRASLGASRGRLIAQSLAEVGVLAVLAGALGSVGSKLLLALALHLLPTQGFPYWLGFGLDGRILAFTVGIVLLVMLVVGLTPAREGARFDLVRALKVGGDGGVIGAGVARSSRRALTVQLALSIALFVGAGMFARSYRNAAALNVGYPAEHVAALALFFNDTTRYPDNAARGRVVSELLSSLRAAPGVSAVASRGFATNVLAGAPAPAKAPKTNVRRPDFRLIPDGDSTRAINQYRVYPAVRLFGVSSGYFDALHLRMTQGRPIDAAGASGRAPVVVVSERLAGLLWPNEAAIGRTLQQGALGAAFTVVGVVQDVRDVQGGSRGVTATPRADAYYSSEQVETVNPELVAYTSASLSRTTAAASALVRHTDPQLITRASSIANTDEVKLIATVFGSIIGLLSIAGVGLSVMGLYGVIAYTVSRRRREIGIRVALGATTQGIVRLFVVESFRFVGVGLVAGLLLAVFTSRVGRIVLLDVSPVDVPVYAIACAVFGGLGLVGCWFPARRAARVDPVSALKAE